MVDTTEQERETIEFIEAWLLVRGVDPKPFIDRCTKGMKTYRQPDNSLNHLAPDFEVLRECDEEIIDAVVIALFDLFRGTYSTNMDIIREVLLSSYKLLAMEKENRDGVS